MDIRRHSATADAAYNDLVRLLLDDVAASLRGAPTVRTINRRRYWYDRYRLGTVIKERFLGEDSDRLRERIEKARELKATSAGRRQERARLVRLLRGERFLGLDTANGSLTAALAKAGVFRLGGVVVGTMAFRLYEGELGIGMSLDQAAMTNDIDIASFEKLSLALEDRIVPSIDEVLADFEFDPVPGLDHGKVWRWRQSNGESRLEFLTPSFDAREDVRDLAALGVSVQSLHYLNYLIAEPIHAAAIYRDGVLIRLPRPERFAIHKLIVADRRRSGPDSQKGRKDLAQSDLLIRVLAEDRPADLAEAWEDAFSRGPRWRARMEASLDRLPDRGERMRVIARDFGSRA